MERDAFGRIDTSVVAVIRTARIAYQCNSCGHKFMAGIVDECPKCEDMDLTVKARRIIVTER